MPDVGPHGLQRLAWSWMQNRGKTLVHLGASGAYMRPRERRMHIDQVPEAHSADHDVVDTATTVPDPTDIEGDGDGLAPLPDCHVSKAWLLVVEAATVVGPFSAQGEIMWYSADSQKPDDIANNLLGGNDPSFMGWYVFVSYFVTGEHRPYKKGRFQRVKPASNFMDGAGTGAVELAIRYSFLDLMSRDVMGGEVTDWTFGANWYLNPQTRVMFNYIRSQITRVGDIDIVQLRFQIDF